MTRERKLELLDRLLCNYASEKESNRLNKENKDFHKAYLLGALEICEYEMEEISNYIFISDIKTEKDIVAYDKIGKKFVPISNKK